jgi:hypothetical protein
MVQVIPLKTFYYAHVSYFWFPSLTCNTVVAIIVTRLINGRTQMCIKLQDEINDKCKLWYHSNYKWRVAICNVILFIWHYLQSTAPQNSKYTVLCSVTSTWWTSIFDLLLSSYPPTIPNALLLCYNIHIWWTCIPLFKTCWKAVLPPLTPCVRNSWKTSST